MGAAGADTPPPGTGAARKGPSPSNRHPLPPVWDWSFWGLSVPSTASCPRVCAQASGSQLCSGVAWLPIQPGSPGFGGLRSPYVPPAVAVLSLAAPVKSLPRFF